ncbi:MAG: glycosyltransferase family 1 protein [Cyanobacteria bacterium P01_A01_bin.137]
MASKNNFRVLHAPTTVGGNPQGLSRALNKLGVNSNSVTLRQTYFEYQADHVLWLEKDSLLAKEIKRIFFLISIVFKYDIIHYNAGTTIATPIYTVRLHNDKFKDLLAFVYRSYRWIFQLIELQILKYSKKALFVTYQGNDARQGDYSLENFEINIASQAGDECYPPGSDEMKRRMIRRLSKYCDAIYALNPDLLHVLPERSKFIPYSHISLDEWTPCFTQMENRKLRIGHAPSHRKIKGTKIILDALDRLEKQGYEFEIILIEGMTNAEAKKVYETIDVLIDQIFAGWYGGLAVEAMALGKPVLVYIRDDDLKYIPIEMANELPFIQINPDNIEEQLRRFLELSRKDLLSLARSSRAYVEKWHDPLKIAAKIKKDYETVLQRT